jgi:quercetin dioxygenase-like cupin family protein
MAIQVIDVESMQKFSTDEVQPIVLHQSEGLVTLLLCLEAGQAVGPCVMTTRVLYLVLAGQGQLSVAGEQERFINASSLAVVPAGVMRTLLAKERSRVLAMQLP